MLNQMYFQMTQHNRNHTHHHRLYYQGIHRLQLHAETKFYYKDLPLYVQQIQLLIYQMSNSRIIFIFSFFKFLNALHYS